MDWTDVKEAIVIIFDRYGKDLSKGGLAMELADYQALGFPPERILWALGEYRRTAKHMRPPMLSEIRAILQPEVDPDAVANDAAGLILRAVKAHGWCNEKAARAELGPYWAIVDRFGGWNFICENLGVRIPQATFYAQARDAAKALITEKRLGQPLAKQLQPSGGEQKELERMDFKQLTQGEK